MPRATTVSAPVTASVSPQLPGQLPSIVPAHARTRSITHPNLRGGSTKSICLSNRRHDGTEQRTLTTCCDTLSGDETIELGFVRTSTLVQSPGSDRRGEARATGSKSRTEKEERWSRCSHGCSQRHV
jgi:hypothetical protein